MDNDKILDLSEDDDFGYSLRPKTLNEFIGQEKAKEQLRIHIEAAKQRSEALEHVLLVSPPGLGKTTLARIIANEIQSNFKQAIGPVMEKLDLASTLTNLEKGDILFIDEIHRVKGYVQESLYPAMEDYQLDLTIGQGPGSDVMQVPLDPFTLVGATTREGLLAGPFRDRFGIRIHLDYYAAEDIQQAIRINSAKLKINIDEDAEYALARRSRGTMRIANKLLANVRDYAEVKGDGILSLEIAEEALEFFDIDERGLNTQDYAYFQTLIENFSGSAGLKALAVALSEDERTISEVYEPYYIKEGFLALTPRGRVATDAAYVYFNYPVSSQAPLFNSF
ncbi:Holliday junction branch migration DNA helicase RuvB [Candidatus Poribacteria bacterium]|nr:Holliday junction branch migration DNA helicase RuvB [Candidatus Poribacteria bacterium]MYH80073.1 Holliday junction branch migration DNA helicase RuvB [Candidatus Poribacteria bacterium]MYK93987.1 Holliday junction branch migration DNA helicase RuvB [Candidatus Poribacteria bacterium]